MVQRRIKIAYEVVTSESARDGDVADRGWEDEEGVPVFGPASAAALLLERGVIEASASSFHPGAWYLQSPVVDLRSGDETTYTYHLHGFPEDEEAQVFLAISRGTAPEESPAEGRRRIEDEFTVEAGVIGGSGPWSGQPAALAWLLEAREPRDTLALPGAGTMQAYDLDGAVRAAFPEVGSADMVVARIGEDGRVRGRVVAEAEWAMLKLQAEQAARAAEASGPTP